MTREAVSKHVRVLESAGLVTAERRGRERWCHLEPGALRAVDDWLTPYRDFWAQRLDALDTEITRGRRGRRDRSKTTGGASSDAAAVHHEGA